MESRWMFADGQILRFIHLRTGEVIRSTEEKDSIIAAQDDEIARLRAEIERLRGDAAS